MYFHANTTTGHSLYNTLPSSATSLKPKPINNQHLHPPSSSLSHPTTTSDTTYLVPPTAKMDLINRELAVISKAHSFHLGTPLNVPDIPGDFNTLVKEIGYKQFFQEVQARNDNLVNKCVMEELWAVITRGKALQLYGESTIASSSLKSVSRRRRLDREWMNEMERACFDAWKEVYRTKEWYKHFDPTYGSVCLPLVCASHPNVLEPELTLWQLAKFDAPPPSEVDWWVKVEEGARARGIIMNNKWNFSPSYHLDPNQDKDLQEDKLYGRACCKMSDEEKITAALEGLGLDEGRA